MNEITKNKQKLYKTLISGTFSLVTLEALHALVTGSSDNKEPIPQPSNGKVLDIGAKLNKWEFSGLLLN